MKVESFKSYFKEEMTSEEALRTYTKLLKSIPKAQWTALDKAYRDIYIVILKRECEQVKKYGIM